MKKNNRKMTNPVLIATMCGHWKEIAQEFGTGIELDFFCQAQNMDGERGEKVKEEVKKLMENYDARVLHGPFNELFPGAIDPAARRLAMDRLNQCADIAIELGVNKMVVHSGFVPFNYFKEWHVPRSIEFWKEFIDDKPDSFQVCIENVLDDEPYMLAEIAEGVRDSRVGLCYDVGHANIKGKSGFGSYGRPETTDQDEWLDVMAPYLKHMHLHNNDCRGDYHKGFEEGTIDIERLLDRAADKCGEDMTITAEILAGRESFAWLKEKGYL